MFSLKMVIFPKSTSWKSYVPIVANCKDFYVSQCLETYEVFLEGYKIHLDFIYLWVASIVVCPQFWGNLDPSCSNDKQFAKVPCNRKWSHTIILKYIIIPFMFDIQMLRIYFYFKIIPFQIQHLGAKQLFYFPIII